jgi:phosphotransferase system HPr-like phosphotransfer protein
MGSSGGGGGSTGTIDYPAYMKTLHGLILDNNGGDTPTNSVIDAFNAAYGNSPFTAATVYDPDTDITAMEGTITSFSALATALAYHTDFDTMSNAAVAQLTTAAPMTDISSAITTLAGLVSGLDHTIDLPAMITTAVASYDTDLEPAAGHIAAKIAAYVDDMNNALNSKVIPLFRAGMRDVGGVMSSAFTIGEVVLAAQMTRETAKFSSDIYLENDKMRVANIEKVITLMAAMLQEKLKGSASVTEAYIKEQGAMASQQAQAINTMAAMLTNKLEYSRVLAAITIEQKRMKIVAKTEEGVKNVEYDAQDAKWDLELFQFVSNVLASISGAAVMPVGKSQLSTALGGALSGAAVGTAIGSETSVGSNWGGAIGGAIGLAAAFA